MRALRLLAVTAVLVAALVRPASGQGTALGVRAGVGRASVSSTEFEFNAGSLTSFQAGVFVTIFTRTSLILQPELAYHRRGFSALVVGGTAKANLSYVELPLLFKLRLGEDTRRLRPSVLLGTFVGFEAGCSLSGNTEGLGSSDCDAILAGRGEMDAGLVLGVGATYGLTGRWFLSTDLRYSLGLLNLSWEAEDDRVASRNWGLTVGVGRFLGR